MFIKALTRPRHARPRVGAIRLGTIRIGYEGYYGRGADLLGGFIQGHLDRAFVAIGRFGSVADEPAAAFVSPARYDIGQEAPEEESMAVNQSPMYVKAEQRYRSAATPQEKITSLEEMLRLVPKHKASEKLQSQLKQKLKVAREQLQRGGPRHGGQQQHDPFAVPKQGAGQVVLLGEPNVGKSAIVGALTKAKVEVAEFAHSTHTAVPGMARHEDVPIQLVDLPPVIEGHSESGMIGAFRSADAILLVVDLSAIELLDQYERPLALLRDRDMRPVSTPALDSGEEESAAVPKRVLVAANKCDIDGASSNFSEMRSLCDDGLSMRAISAKTGSGLDAMMADLFDLLHVIRVYAKKPGKPVDKANPFVLPKGGTVYDVARLVHRELAEKLKTARLWGGKAHDGQQVHHTHELGDQDVVELHF